MFINNFFLICFKYNVFLADLSEEEKLRLMRSEQFQNFIDRSSRIIERALFEDADIFVDYTGVKEESERLYIHLN